MARICPNCGGKVVGCPVCDYPARHRLTVKRNIRSFAQKVTDILKPETTWEVQGVDLSAWNGIMDFSITKTKCQYGFIRLGYGNSWKDYRADTYYADAQAQDFPLGGYWYAKVGESWDQHAISFAQEFLSHPMQLKDPVIDVESTTLDPNASLAWIINMDTRLTNLTGRKAMFYTAKYFWEARVARSTYFQGRLLWTAHWTTASTPLIPKDFLSWRHWQHSADGNGKAKEYGMVKDGDYDMDLNRYNGTVQQFNTQYGTHIQPPEPPPPSTKTQFVVISNELNIRSAPSINAPVIGKLYKGNPVDVLDAGGNDVWIKHDKGWSAYQTGGIKYMQPK